MVSDDPTASKTRRDKWTRRFNGRWQQVTGTVRRELDSTSPYQPRNDVETAHQIAAFEDFLAELVESEVVEPMNLNDVMNGSHYTAAFVREFYYHGIRHADRLLNRAGYPTPDDASPQRVVRDSIRADTDASMLTTADLLAPGDDWDEAVHSRDLRAKYVWVYRKVRDAAQAATAAAVDEYAGVVRASGSLKSAYSAIRDRINKIGKTRTEMIAKSEAVDIINTSAVNRYQQQGVKWVGVESEFDVAFEGEVLEMWRTAEDSAVCDQCRALSGNVYKIPDIRSGSAPRPVVDTHPRCRCMYVPVPLENRDWPHVPAGGEAA